MTILIIVAKFLALMLAAIIAGSTTYISMVEVPARAKLGAPIGPTSWREFFPRAMKEMKRMGFALMIALALCFVVTFNFLWLIAIIPAFALGPYTAIRMAPINQQLLDSNLDLSSKEAHELTCEWGKRHLIRTLMALSSLALAILAAITF